MFGFTTIILVIAGMTAIYFLYSYLYTTGGPSNVMTVIPGKISAAAAPSPEKLPMIPLPFEGGEYSFSTWIYISSFNKNRNVRKHIFELRGDHFSTLLVGLGAFKNTLVVRTHTKDLNVPIEGFQATPISSSSGPTNTTPPNAGTAGTTSLGRDDMNALFAPMAMDDSILTTQPMCDLPEIDLQRWVMITVVLSGRTVDVYLDGKLARSCVAPSYYKVDPTGVKPVVADKGGFDGYIASTSVANYAMNPDEIYRAYASGPEGTSNDLAKWFGSLFSASS